MVRVRRRASWANHHPTINPQGGFSRTLRDVNTEFGNTTAKLTYGQKIRNPDWTVIDPVLDTWCQKAAEQTDPALHREIEVASSHLVLIKDVLTRSVKRDQLRQPNEALLRGGFIGLGEGCYEESFNNGEYDGLKDIDYAQYVIDIDDIHRYF